MLVPSGNANSGLRHDVFTEVRPARGTIWPQAGMTAYLKPRMSVMHV